MVIFIFLRLFNYDFKLLLLRNIREVIRNLQTYLFNEHILKAYYKIMISIIIVSYAFPAFHSQ